MRSAFKFVVLKQQWTYKSLTLAEKESAIKTVEKKNRSGNKSEEI